MAEIKRSLIKAMEKIGTNFHLKSALHVQRAQCTQCAYAIALDFNIKFCDTYGLMEFQLEQALVCL